MVISFIYFIFRSFIVNWYDHAVDVNNSDAECVCCLWFHSGTASLMLFVHRCRLVAEDICCVAMITVL